MNTPNQLATSCNQKLKAIYQAIQEARYAMVDGNLSKEWIPPECVKGWLDAIERALE